MELICGHDEKHHAKGLCLNCYEFARQFIRKKRELDKQHGKEIKILKGQLGELGLRNIVLVDYCKRVHEYFTVIRPELTNGEIGALIREIKTLIDKQEG